MIKRKRGRPVGSKNKLNKKEQAAVDSFSETLAQWDRQEQEVDFKDLCQKLQTALAKSYCDYECLEKHVHTFRDEITRRDIIIQYLESRIR
jgi:hypothetical protein